MVSRFNRPSTWSALLAFITLLVLGVVALTDAQETNTQDVSLAPSHLWAFTGENGGAMLAARIANSGSENVSVEVDFYEGDPDHGGRHVARGGLEVPAHGAAIEAVPWPPKAGEHTITAVVDPDDAIVEADEANNRATRKIVCEMVPRFSHEYVSMEGPLTGPIIPGRGLNELGVGDTREAVERILGVPEDKSTDRWLVYRKQHGLDFFLAEDGRVNEMRFNPGFEGMTMAAVGIGDSIDKAVKASGGAKKTVKASSRETHSVAKGSDCVLYEKEENGRITAYKFIDKNKGILYWADGKKRITQIVTFPARSAGAA